jgi:hypothetical protein
LVLDARTPAKFGYTKYIREDLAPQVNAEGVDLEDLKREMCKKIYGSDIAFEGTIAFRITDLLAQHYNITRKVQS